MLSMYPGTCPGRRRWLQGGWEGPKVARFLEGSWAHTPVSPAFSPGTARYWRSPDTGRGQGGPPCRAEGRSQGRGTVTQSWKTSGPPTNPNPPQGAACPQGHLSRPSAVGQRAGMELKVDAAEPGTGLLRHPAQTRGPSSRGLNLGRAPQTTHGSAGCHGKDTRGWSTPL